MDQDQFDAHISWLRRLDSHAEKTASDTREIRNWVVFVGCVFLLAVAVTFCAGVLSFFGVR